MVEAKVSASQQFSDQQMEICSCGNFNAIFYCRENPHCYGQDSKEQMLYCSECMEKFHAHQPIRIATVSNELGKNWSLLFEKIENVFAVGSKIYEELENFILFCESENNKLPQDQKYIGPSYNDDFMKLYQLHKLVIKESKEYIENLIKDIKIKEIFTQEQKCKEYNALIQNLEYWATMTDDQVFQRYSNVFLESCERSFDKIPKEALKSILKYKSQVISEIVSQPADLQNQVPNANFNSLMKLNNEQILILDSKAEQSIQQSEERIATADTKISQIQVQIMRYVDQIEDKITTIDNQIKEKQPVSDKEMQLLQSLVKDLKANQISLDQKINKIETNHQNDLNQFMRFSFTLFKLQNNDEKASNNSFCKLLNKKVTSNEQIWNILQLKDRGHIISSPNKNETYSYEAITLQQLQKLKISSEKILSAIEHRNFIFITNWNNQVLMVKSSDYSFTSSEDNLYACTSLCGVDNNHIIAGSYNGYLYFFNIQNNTLSLKHQKQYYGDKVQQIVKLNADGLMGVSVDGVKIVQVTNNNEIQELSNYLKNQTISSMIEYQDEQLICGSYSKKCYYLINLQSKTETKLAEAYSPVLAMTLFPNFHPLNYPFILTRELEWVCILNMKTKFNYKLVKCSGQFHAIKCGSSIIFLKDQGLTFMTFDGKFELARYKIEDSLMEYLAIV